ncbi:MAG TPA: UvrD-helicase domain-containing protein [Steroidobacteraceae bacterium]|nr:UvrD-helicase domain-containing protein [Steroidobacteraceae bacterium]
MIEQPVGPPDLFDQPDLFDRPGSVDERRAVDPPRPVGRPGAAAEPDPADRSAPVDQPDPADRSDPVDQPARRRAIEATGSVLVQAPAGSGKTTLLAQRYLRLLATVDAPERILALTFTRRAAQEMRERVLQALHAAGASDRPAQMNAQTWELGVAARRRMSELGFDLVRHPSRLRIETIDAFNTWLAGQLPVTAGAGARLNLTDDPRPLYEEAARRAMAHDEADQFGHAVERVLAQDDQRWESLVRLISGMLASRDRWLPLLAGHLHATRTLDELQLRNIRRQLDEDLRLLVTRSLTAAQQAFEPERLQALSQLMHAAARRLEDPAPAVSQWRLDDSVLRADAGDLARWRDVAALLTTNEAAYRKRLTKQEGFPPLCADKSVMTDLITELERTPAVLRTLVKIRGLPEPAYDDEQWERVREVALVLVLAAAQLEHVFRDEGMVDFPAVSMAAVRALGTAAAPTDLNLRLDYQLRHVLVDEFQDTSSAQLELVKLLTAGWEHGDGRSVFCVGDPMQSIYGFRQAEVRAFLELAEEGIGDVRFEPLRLRSNFRSAKPLVDWINRCFSAILPRADDRERGAIAFRPSEPAMAPGAQPSGAVTLKGFASRREEADAIAALIGEHAAANPEWRIVVLVRARNHARDVAASLRSRSIQFRAVDIEPLQDRPAVRDVIALIRALLHLGDRTAWLALLRAPWTGLTLNDLLKVARGAPIVWEALADDSVLSGLTGDGRLRCERLRRTLDAAFRIRTHGPISRWVEQTWLALGGPACATGAEDLDQVRTAFARLALLEERGLPDPADLESSFSDLFASTSAPAAVEIMTIHKAKGLEFDMVVVPALDRHVPLHRDQLLLSHQFSRAGRDGLVLAARPGIGAQPDDLFEFLRRQTRDSAALEAERLLYVACTRAKWRLHLSAMVGRPEDGDGPREDVGPTVDGSKRRAPWKPRSGSLLAVLWPVAAAEFSLDAADPDAPGRTAAGRKATEAGGDVAPRGGPLYRLPLDWSPPADEALPTGGQIAASSAPREETPVFDWAGETARRVGSLVHAELQVMDVEHGDEGTIESRGPHFKRWLGLHGVPAERLEGASARVVSALVAVHRDERARWILRRRTRDDFREYALSGRWQGEVVRVVFDRSFIAEDGVRWVIDYKTSQHAGGSLDEFLDREVERYRGQLHRYAQLARKLGPERVRVGLYFPLMRAWREWEPD